MVLIRMLIVLNNNYYHLYEAETTIGRYDDKVGTVLLFMYFFTSIICSIFKIKFLNTPFLWILVLGNTRIGY